MPAPQIISPVRATRDRARSSEKRNCRHVGLGSKYLVSHTKSEGVTERDCEQIAGVFVFAGIGLSQAIRSL